MVEDLSNEQLDKLKDILYIQLNSYNIEKNPEAAFELMHQELL